VSLYDGAVDELTCWVPPTRSQARLRASYLRHLHEHPDGLTRECHPDHLTASLLIVNAQRDRVLLNLHRKYAIWVQFGGHCEAGDSSLAGAAIREGEEESGISGLRLVAPGPAQLSRHQVVCGPVRPAHHLDVRYVAVAPADAEPVASDESIDVRWFATDATPSDLEPELRDLLALATHL
jgi:8-oxo-dGTP pyrophosphatase MutT (NUDIX family)